MIDFNKDDLKDLKMIIDAFRGYTSDLSQIYMPIYKKIQTMLDNYNDCDHNITMTDTFTKCARCNTVLGY